jgi:hypothetical protein
LRSSKEEAQGHYCFQLLLTPKLRADFEQTFSFAKKIEQSGHAVMRERTFQEIFADYEKQFNLKAELRERYVFFVAFIICVFKVFSILFSGSPIKCLVELLEISASAYKFQYTKCILDGLRCDDKFPAALKEIKVGYFFRVAIDCTNHYIIFRYCMLCSNGPL